MKGKNMRKKIIVFALLIVIIITCNTYAEFRLAKGPTLDGWSGMRLGAGALTYGVNRLFKIKPVPAFLITIGVGVFWEVYFDGFQNKIPFDLYPPDPAGADLLGDAVWMGVGACIGVAMEYVFKELTGRKGKVYIHDNKAYLVIPL